VEIVMMIQKQKPIRMQKLRDSANGAQCLIQSPVCNNNPETSVLCHYRSHDTNAGMGVKPDDTSAAIACSSCHDWLDGRNSLYSPNKKDKEFFWFRGVLRTFRYWVDEGILK
jgi:hypothetical protein